MDSGNTVDLAELCDMDPNIGFTPDSSAPTEDNVAKQLVDSDQRLPGGYYGGQCIIA
uniref:Phb3.1.42 n=1 Tax=Coprinopsis cinerea TaxID=5346 RepID=Q9UVM9_COPCI|nr:Phb3.1.42 [Coprinopsis cinerea]